MDLLILVVLALIGALAAGGAYWAWSSREEPAREPPSRAWKGDTVTPVILGPRNRAPERVAREYVVTQGALLAMNMARADGQITDEERAAIRQFLLEHVTNHDAAQAQRALEQAESEVLDPAKLEAAIDALRAISSTDQRKVLVELLVHVAQADGVIKPEELAFMKRVGSALGLSEADVRARISLS
jgi:uncharacterized tellurite resistance protein B-like protein